LPTSFQLPLSSSPPQRFQQTPLLLFSSLLSSENNPKKTQPRAHTHTLSLCVSVCLCACVQCVTCECCGWSKSCNPVAGLLTGPGFEPRWSLFRWRVAKRKRRCLWDLTFLKNKMGGVGLSFPGIALWVVPVFPSVCWLLPTKARILC
jgi:hypothetical protein